MKKLVYVFGILISTYCTVLLISCSDIGQKVTPVKIGINEWMGYDPFILADKINLFEKNNVNVEIKRFASATEEMQAIIDGKLHGAGFTLDEVFSLVNMGFEGKVVLVVDYSVGGDMLIGQKEIKNINELEGKTIGYEGSVVGEFLLDRAFSMHHLKTSSVTLIDVQANSWHSAFKEKRVDAVVCFNPIATVLLEEEEGNLLFSSAEIPFEIIDVLIFSKSFYDSQKTDIANILKSWFDAIKYIQTNQDDAAEIISSAKNIRPEIYKLGQKGLIAPDLNVNRTIFDSKSPENIYKYSQVIVSFMISKKMLSNRINTEDLFQNEILYDIQMKGESKSELYMK